MLREMQRKFLQIDDEREVDTTNVFLSLLKYLRKIIYAEAATRRCSSK